MQKVKLLAITAVVSFLLIGCSIGYKIDVAQGNEITKEDLQKISIGMAQEDVGKIIGYPLLNDVFHKDRWDYMQTFIDGKTQKEQRSRVTLYFSNGLLQKIDESDYTEVNKEQ